MWKKLAQIFSVPELRKKLLITIGLLVIFRALAHIPIPGVDADNLKNFFNQNQIFGLLDVFSGGGLSNLSIVMAGVSPYITASIIMQLLTLIIPSFERMQKEDGEEGRRKLNQYTRWLTVPLALLQAYGTLALFSRSSSQVIGDLSGFQLATTLLTVCAGSLLLMWIGEIITEQGIGNGVSIVIFAGIIARLPATIQQSSVSFDSSNLLNLGVFLLIGVAVIAAVVFMTEAQRNIPVSYARRMQGGKLSGGRGTYLPLRVNQSGVVPIIFGLSIMLFPGVIANFFLTSKNETIAHLANSVKLLFANQLFYGSIYFVLIVLFTFFYASITFDPKAIAENLQKSGGFIPGIRPGKNTMDYLSMILYRVSVLGALFLAGIAVLPFLTEILTHSTSLVVGGTGLLIVVGVVLEVSKQIESQLLMRDYDGF